MTTPSSQTPTSPVPPVVEEHDAAALLLEAAAAAATVSALQDAISKLVSWVRLEWVRTFGTSREPQEGPKFRAYVRNVAQRIQDLPEPDAEVMVEYAERARIVGVLQGMAEAGVDVPGGLTDRGPAKTAAQLRDAALDFVPRQWVPFVREGVTDNTVGRADNTVKVARDKVRTATRLVESLQSGTVKDVDRVVAVAQAAANLSAATAKSLAVAELNHGIAASAKALGAQLLWVAERDACRWCGSLSGHFPDEDGVFTPDGFGGGGTVPYRLDEHEQKVPLTVPPLHNHCRCRITPWLGHNIDAASASAYDWAREIADAEKSGDALALAAAHKAAANAKAAAASTDLPAALRREAERSVLNGYALPSESVPARTQAADRLLALIGDAKNSRSPSGWQVPASVKKRARTALNKGTFTTRPAP